MIKLFFITFWSLLIILAPQNLLADAKSALEIGEDEFVIGNKDAPITIIEYASMSCSHCASFHNNTLPDIKKEYIDAGKVRMVFRDYPFNYPALLGSMMM